ncbi:O-antigen ligase family protein [Reinekea marinisedimentorum]|uniref:Putative O-glycosylation ligase (Exosortase A-associated) n=1 Tax=Reinekea marinisedimentorum TaxID=230495 RepID=A0A4R3I8C8_9GAMM|nr:O-antigen ligase family protein [Reinekea marinisedimentorum]TCS42374.1 putative O-glycosylation ligase (exosortase A-associated) [Reinekea marinisedimentorum]
MTPKVILLIVGAALMLAATHLLKQPLVLLVLPLMVPAAWAVLRFPVWVCLGFIVFSFFRIHEAIPALLPLKIPQLLALAAFGVLGWHLFLTEKIKAYWHPLMGLLLMFFILIVFGAFMATDRGSAMAILQGSYVKVIAMVFAIAWLVRTPKDFHLTTVFILVAGAIISCIAIFNKMNGIGLVEGTRVTISRDIGSMIGDPNDLALVLTFPLSFAVSASLNSKANPFFRILALLVSILVVWAIICTQSRGGLLGICAVFGTLAWLKVKNKLLVMGAGGFLMVMLVAAAGISDRSSGGSAEAGIDASAMGRIHAWQAAMSMAVHNPITGVGINNFYANYYFHTPHWDGKNHAVHSTWFQILAEAGFIGLALFLSLVLACYKLAIGNIRDTLNSDNPALTQISPALLAGIVSFCTSGTFLTQGFIWPLYILIALTIALNQYLSTQRSTL